MCAQKLIVFENQYFQGWVETEIDKSFLSILSINLSIAFNAGSGVGTSLIINVFATSLYRVMG